MAAAVERPPHLKAILDSPGYLKAHPRPKSPRDLVNHRCINFRHGSEGVYRWEFEKGKKSLSVAVNGPLIVDDLEIVTRAAIDGVGLAFTSEEHAAPHFETGALTRVLEAGANSFRVSFCITQPSAAAGHTGSTHQDTTAVILPDSACGPGWKILSGIAD